MVPYRVVPGRLAVSRAIGDAEAKLSRFHGKPKVVIAKPDIFAVNVEDGLDFAVLCSDGVFDKLSNQEVVGTVWRLFKAANEDSLHSNCEKAARDIVKVSLEKRSTDNVTAVVILFSNAARKESPIKELALKSMQLTLRSNRKLLNVNKGSVSRVGTNRGARKLTLKFIRKNPGAALPEIAVSSRSKVASPYCS